MEIIYSYYSPHEREEDLVQNSAFPEASMLFADFLVRPPGKLVENSKNLVVQFLIFFMHCNRLL